MEEKKEFLVELCNRNYRRLGVRITFEVVVDGLNYLGYRTELGHEYSYDNSRGVGRLISCVVRRLHNEGRIRDAHDVAHTFVNSKGEYAFE